MLARLFGHERLVFNAPLSSSDRIVLEFTPYTQAATNPGTILTEIGTYELINGTTQAVGDALLERQTLTGSIYKPVEETPTVQGLPDFRGFGSMRNLRQAMSSDPDLAADVASLLAGTPQQIVDGMDAVLYC